MKWGDFDLNWGRPLKSIMSIFDKKVINFEFHHLISSNSTFTDKDLEEKKKPFKNFKEYEKFFEKQGIIVDQNKRLKIINRFFYKILNKKRLKINENSKLPDSLSIAVGTSNSLNKFSTFPNEIRPENSL